MDIAYFGLSSVRLRGKKTTLVIDPFVKEKAGISFETTPADGVLLTSRQKTFLGVGGVKDFRVVIDGAGEYEIGGVSIIGVAAGEGTTYIIKMDGITFLHLGLLGKQLTEQQIDKYPSIDILFVPVGGTEAGTVSAKEATDLVAKLEPKLIIPIGFKRKDDTKLSLPMAPVADFLKEMGKETIAGQSKLTITKEKLPAEPEVIVLE